MLKTILLVFYGIWLWNIHKEIKKYAELEKKYEVLNRKVLSLNEEVFGLYEVDDGEFNGE